MPNAHVKVPSAWRIIRAHLAVRESSTFNDIYNAVKEHRPNYNRKRFENKLTHMRSAGLVTNLTKTDEQGKQKAQRGVYRLTQAGRIDYADPEELHGLPSHDGTTSRSKAQLERARANEPGRPKRDGANLVKARVKLKEMRENGTLVYRKPAGRPRKTQAAAPAQTPMVTIAGAKTPVDSELIERLLSASKPQLTDSTVSTRIIDIPGIRLKVTVEVL